MWRLELIKQSDRDLGTGIQEQTDLNQEPCKHII